MFLESLSGLTAFMDTLKSLVGLGEALEERKKELIRTLGKAARDTEIAIHKLRKGENTIPDLESTIAAKWVEASALLKNEDKELALQLYAKGQAWSGAREWTEEDFATAISNIQKVDEYVQKILNK